MVTASGPFCGGAAPPTEAQILIWHHQALLYLITMKPHDIITQTTNHIVQPPNMKILVRTLVTAIWNMCIII